MTEIVKRLNDKHPAMQALGNIFEMMHEKGIKIDVSDNILTVHHEGKVYRMLDLKKSYCNAVYSGVYSLPPECEYKLCYEVVATEQEPMYPMD